MSVWAFDVGDFVSPSTGRSFENDSCGVVIARELYETDTSESRVYYVRWGTNTGGYDKEVIRHSACELSRKEKDER